MTRLYAAIVLALICASSARADMPCGTTISSPGAYALEDDKSCPAGWLTIAADDVVINGGGHTVTYGHSSSAHGIVVQDGSENLTIYAMALTQGTAGLNGIDAQNADIGGLNVDGVTFNLNVTNSTACIHATYGTANNIDIHDSTFNVNATGQAWGIFLSGDADGAVSGNIRDNTFIFGNAVNIGRPAAVRLTGYSGDATTHPVFSGNDVTIHGVATYAWVGWATNHWIVANNTITLSSLSDNSKGIQLDGGSDHNDVYNNTIDINSNNVSSASYGVRVRFASSNNTIRNNNINIADSTGYGSLGISVGADQATEPTAVPSNNFVYSNTVIGGGDNIPIQIYEDLSDSYFYCNALTNESGHTVTTYSGGVIDGVEFSENTHTSDGDAVRIVGAYTVSGLSFCRESVNGEDMSVSDITDVSEVGGWSVADSGCVYGCGSNPVPVDPDDQTPTTSGPLLRTGSYLLRVGDSVLMVQ